MARPARTSPARHALRGLARRTLGTVGAALVALLAVVTALAGATPGAPGAADRAAVEVPVAPVAAPWTPPTSFQVATLNLLGYSHTVPGGDRTGYASGTQRMVWAVQLLDRHGIDLVGFQEMEGRQYDKFTRLTSGAWESWPGRTVKDGTYSSLAWRRADWTAVEKRIYMTPYFYGKNRPRPLVQLRNNHTGQLVWFTNTHNPSNTRGDAKQWRDASERIQANYVNALRAAYPSIPVIFTGDMNDNADFYCPVAYLSDLESASGGRHPEPGVGGVCEPAKPDRIDWIMGTPDIAWSQYAAVRDDLVRQTTDHPIVFATAGIAPQQARAAGVQRVVVLDVQGLRSSAVSPSTTPYISELLKQSAATLQARPSSKPTRTLPNTISMLTGRPVGRSGGGHGVGASRDSGSTVHKAAKQYVSSIFDVAHNLGVRTAFYSGDPESTIVPRTWDTKAAGTDSWGVDNGRGKITSRTEGSDKHVAATARRKLAAGVGGVTVVQLNDAMEAGVKRGWTSRSYVAALRTADKRVAGIMATIARNPATAASTLVVVTSSTRGAPATYGYGVPLLVWGPSVRAGDLYAQNRAYVDPGAASSSPNPILVADIANLTADALLLPSIPRSLSNAGRTLDVFAP